MKTYLSYLLLLYGLGCMAQAEVLEISYDKALIPEGIAVDSKQGKLYLSSIHRRKIVETDLASGKSIDFIGSGAYGYKPGIGITVKDHRLFALGSEKKNDSWSSILLVLDLEDGSLLHSYKLNEEGNHLMNDLAISRSGQIFITDTERHRVYKLDYPDGSLSVFLDDAQIQYPNGIAISEDNTKLFVDSWSHGIRVVDIKTGEILNGKHEGTTKIGLDGLKYHAGHLYAIRNGGEKEAHGLIKIPLSENEQTVGGIIPLLVGHEKMNLPTTLAIAEGHIYVLANSQLDNLNQDTYTVIDEAKLTPTYILKYKIEQP
ncbi:SMP-30/gluconolactonase/LRE family protein [Flavobacteriaceae bacterium 3-367]|uniref:SMP-30/gluconolactonase/LRE family protein n=1 Tax=Eudoraea algarum TaxID=3417568 RepID=UPI00327F12FC